MPAFESGWGVINASLFSYSPWDLFASQGSSHAQAWTSSCASLVVVFWVPTACCLAAAAAAADQIAEIGSMSGSVEAQRRAMHTESHQHGSGLLAVLVAKTGTESTEHRQHGSSGLVLTCCTESCKNRTVQVRWCCGTWAVRWHAQATASTRLGGCGGVMGAAAAMLTRHARVLHGCLGAGWECCTVLRVVDQQMRGVL